MERRCGSAISAGEREMAEQRKFSNTTKTSGPQDDVHVEVDRLQAQLDELRSKLNTPFAESPGPAASPSPWVVRAILRARRKRDAIFGEDLFADPAWDILLELYAATLIQRRVPTSKLCKAAAVPETTALRWIEKLHRLGWVARHADPLDARRVFVELTSTATAAMQSYFEEIEAGVVVC